MVMMRNLIKKYIIFIIMIFVLPGIGLAAPDQGGKQPVKPGPKEAAKRPSSERFYQCLERLLNGYGHDPAKWPDQVDKITVNLYLKEVLGLTPDQVVFRRNMLGYGVGETKAQARADFEKGRVDAWGVPYDLILASSGSDARVRSIMAGVAITQGFEAYNEELTEKTYILLKADLHSQFGEVFRNFNGRTINIRAREINFMGCPGSGLDEYSNQIKPALAAAHCLRAAIYIGNQDQVPHIPRSFGDLVNMMERSDKQSQNPSRSAAIKREVPVVRVFINGCSHAIEGYLAGMRFYGQTMLKPIAANKPE